MPMESFEPGPLALVAVEHLDRARAEILSGGDAIPALDAALAALRMEAGEMPIDHELACADDCSECAADFAAHALGAVDLSQD